MRELDLTDDIIDVRDIISRYEELEDLVTEQDTANVKADDLGEALILGKLLDELKGCGGDKQWRGDWYPVTLIKNSYFIEYATDLVKDIGDMPRNIPSYIEIDWEATANNIQQDYQYINIGEDTYWYR
jgi:hypothetical protein